MSIGAISNLRDVRANLLGFSLEGVVRLSSIPLDRLQAVEQGKAELTVWEAETLSRVYGIEADVLTDRPLRVPPQAVVSTLASRDEFHVISDANRARVVAAARASRDIVVLRKMLDVPEPSVPAFHAPTRPELKPFHDGMEVADDVRRTLGPESGAILSMRDWVKEKLPGVAVLYARLGVYGPAGLTFASGDFGPAVVLNLEGKNENPSVRRFSLAHEIYHLLVDWQRTEPLVTLSGYVEQDQGFEREQRANSFATRFICPEPELLKLSTRGAEEIARTLIVKWGLHYAATRLYMINCLRLTLPPTPPADLRASGIELWEDHEKPSGVAGFPLRAVPEERRNIVAELASQAYARGLIQRDRYADFLDVSPVEDLERVTDFFGLDAPLAEQVA